MRRTVALLLTLLLALSLSLAATASVALDREPPRVPECVDGVDNDGDRLVDRQDPNCRSRTDNSEAPPDRD